ncbi:MAG: potassium transporter Kup [Roseiarcus sp.]
MSALAAAAAPGKEAAPAWLALGALGVVFGDIGTSPLYAVKLCFLPLGRATPLEVYGVLSLIAWALFVVVTLKYVIVIMRADNRGEGGILALTALALRTRGRVARPAGWMLLAGLTGAALFYGDGVITPAISVLSAVEGLRVATPAFDRLIVPLALAILLGLFLVQRFGAGRLGGLFGIVTTAWFVTIGLIGAAEIAGDPAILFALNPWCAVRLLAAAPLEGFALLGAVVLAVTGAEALYADIGQFGKGPIRLAWLGLVLPALLLNYFGQGALLLRDPGAAHDPFFRLAPGWALYPLVTLATLATVIASQAMISGAFSMTQQAVRLGYLPRFEIRHTSAQQPGQIYIPAINAFLMAAVAAVVLIFRSSENMGAAYGIAVTGTMALTTALAFVVMTGQDGWNRWAAAAVFGLFLIVDLAFLAASSLKIAHGGWVPVAVALLMLTLMYSWLRGAEALVAARSKGAESLEGFLAGLDRDEPPRVPGLAVYLTPNDRLVPAALVNNLEHNRVLHERVVMMRVLRIDFPHATDKEKYSLVALPHGFFVAEVRYGFMDQPDIPRALAQLRIPDLKFDLGATSFFIGRDKIAVASGGGLWAWRKRLFIFMHLVMVSATDYYRIPSRRVVELGEETRI